MRFSKKELEVVAKQNYWNGNWHTLYILRELRKTAAFPGEYYALNRAIQIIRRLK